MIKNLTYVFGCGIESIIEKVEFILKSENQEIANICKSWNVKAPEKSVYYAFPYLFYSDYSLSEDIMTKLCIMSVMCLDFCLFSDKMFDQQITVSQELYYHKILVYQSFIKNMLQFDHKIQVEDYYNKYYQEYVCGVREEEKHFNSTTHYSWEEFMMIAKGKQALAKIIPAIMGIQLKNVDKISKYEQAMDSLAVASQLYDDLCDWKEDFRMKRMSWMLHDILEQNHLDWNCEEKKICELLHLNNYDLLVLEKANQLCEEAMLVVGHNSTWIRYVRLFQIKVNRLYLDFAKLKGYTFKRYPYTYYCDKKDSMETVIKRSWNFLLEQYQNGLSEVTHWMFSCQGHEEKQKLSVLPADIFQRACMLNLIFEIKENEKVITNKKLDEIIEREVAYLISSISKDYDCGWVYCNELYGNCPDLDTLSEILRINKKVHNEELKKQVEKTLEKVKRIHKGTVPFQSWIIESGNKDFDIICKNFSKGQEIDVNANFIISLDQTDFEDYKDIVERCFSWISKMQGLDGMWESTWYVGDYYCGYVLSKGLFLMKIDHQSALCKYIDFVFDTQKSDGSWGDCMGNPLDTAYAIMTLCNIGAHDKKTKNAVERGVHYLLSTNNNGGYWYGCEFIKTGLGKTDISQQIYRYRSSILTTMFCVGALCKGDHFLTECYYV